MASRPSLSLAKGPFADTSQSPGYFGSGNYGDGGASSTGGYDQRWRSRNPGRLGEDTFTREHAAREMRGRYRAGPKGYTRSDDRIHEDICERADAGRQHRFERKLARVREGWQR